MKKYKLIVLMMFAIMLFITGCEEESTAPDPYSNGLLITLAKDAGSKKYNAQKDVTCLKDGINLVKFTAENSDGEVWDIEFIWGANAQNGDTVFISENNLNTIKLTSDLVGDHFIESYHSKASETFIRVIELTDEVKIEAEIEGFIYEIGGSTAVDSLKDGYFITKNFN